MSGKRAVVRGGTRQASGSERHLRADAQRNLDRILAAAREAFLEHGPDAPLDEIARRAGVGIATLYRRFPDRHALARGVALDVWQRVAHEARLALAEEPTAFQALARYMHAALDLGIGAVMPMLMEQIVLDKETQAARDQSVEPLQRMIAAAQADGSLRADVVFTDMGLLLIRLNRPLPGPFSRALDQVIAHRQLDLLLAGLRADGAQPAPLPGPTLTLEDLRSLRKPATEPE